MLRIILKTPKFASKRLQYITEVAQNMDSIYNNVKQEEEYWQYEEGGKYCVVVCWPPIKGSSGNEDTNRYQEDLHYI